jgi:hypothetical protein
MKYFPKFLLLFCIGLCSLVNVGYAQETDENTTSEKSALVIQAGCVEVVYVAEVEKPTGYLFVTRTGLNDLVTVYSNSGANDLATLKLSYGYDLQPKPIAKGRDVDSLYNQFPNFKSKLTERFYRYRFSC